MDLMISEDTTILSGADATVRTTNLTPWKMLRRSAGQTSPELLGQLATTCAYDSRRLADRLGVSSRQLQRHFRAYYDTTPHAWLKERRLAEARRRLSHARSVKEVAVELGYPAAPQFSRDFKARFGITPSRALGKSLNV